jgi:competence protein ComEC
VRRLLCLLILLLCGLSLADELEIHFIDVGQGDAVLLRSPTGQNVLYDGGRGRWRALEYLQAIGVDSLDLVIASHADADHIAGLIEVVLFYQPTYFMDNEIVHTTLTYENLLLAVERVGSILLEPTAQRITLGSVILQVLPPPGIRSWGNNENSVGLVVEYGDFRLGLTGDMEHRQFAWWSENHPELLVPVQVYKSSHHGSPNGDSPAVMAAFQPEVVVISVGEGNSFGHPAPQILELYYGVGAAVFRTDLQGSVIVRASEDGAYTISTTRDVQLARPLPGQVIPVCIDLNTASLEALTQIVHIDEVRAGEVINLRPYSDIEQLTQIRGIAAARLQDILEQGLACIGEQLIGEAQPRSVNSCESTSERPWAQFCP